MKTFDTPSQDLSKVFEVQANFSFDFSNFWSHFALAYVVAEAAAVKKGTESRFTLPKCVDVALGGMFQGDNVSFEFANTSKKTFFTYNPKKYVYNLFTVDVKNSLVVDSIIFDGGAFTLKGGPFEKVMFTMGEYLAKNHPELLAPFDEFEPGCFRVWEN